MLTYIIYMYRYCKKKNTYVRIHAYMYIITSLADHEDLQVSPQGLRHFFLRARSEKSCDLQATFRFFFNVLKTLHNGSLQGRSKPRRKRALVKRINNDSNHLVLVLRVANFGTLAFAQSGAVRWAEHVWKGSVHYSIHNNKIKKQHMNAVN